MAAPHSKTALMEKATTPNVSLHDIIVRHKLHAHPLRWTARHLKALHLTFQQIDIPPEAETGVHEEDAEPYATHLANNPWGVSPSKGACFMDLFTREGSRLEKDFTETTFFFRGRVVHQTDCQVYYPASAPFHAEDKKIAELILGFCHYTSITRRREERCYRKRRRDRLSTAVQRRFDREFKECTPETWFQDPYLVCLMISLARNQWTSARCDFYPVRLTVCHDDDKVNAYVYYAEFPRGILDQLETPTHKTKATWPTIYYTKIPFEPYGTFADRIAKALLDAKVGMFPGVDETRYSRVEEEEPTVTWW